MTTLSSEELQAQRSGFGLQLSSPVAKYGPLCVGIDSHRKLLTDWGYDVDTEGAELFSICMLQAASGRAAAVKFQTPVSERYGAKGFEALGRVFYTARQMGIITIVDYLCGGPFTTTSAIADVYSRPGASLLADVITLLSYYGMRSLNSLITEALENGHGMFIVSLTPNPEGMSLRAALYQGGDCKGRIVAYGIVSTVQKHDVDIEGMGSVGLTIGVTVDQWIRDSGVDLFKFTGPILSFGYGWQSAEAKDLKTVFRGTHGNILVTMSRFIASHGPDIAALSQVTESIALDVRQALVEATVEGSKNQ